MPLTNAYATLDAAKGRLRIADDGDAGTLEEILTGASRAIDRWVGRRFYGATETRYYTPASATLLLLPDDLRTVTTLKTDEDGDRTYETTWATTDYYLGPANAIADGDPYSEIETDPINGRYEFPLLPRSVQIVGAWGFCATGSAPAPIVEATLRLAERLYKLRDAPLGVAGTIETGVIRIASDRDLEGLLWPYRRRRGFA